MVKRDAVLDAWDEMFNAAQRVETALPFQMSEAIASLEAARKNMSTVLQSWATTSEASLQRQLSEAVERAEKADGWAKDWHGIIETICTVLELGTLDADQVVAAVRAKFEKAERERVEQWNLRRDREASLMVEKAVTDSMRIERDRYKRGLETLACTFYKDDQYQDYAKHVLDAARAALQGEPE